MSGTLTTPTNPVKVCAKTGVGAATVNWTASGTDTIDIHLDAPSGTLFARGGRDGTAETGPWVREGTTLYLQNIARYVPLTPDNTLARLVFRTVPGGPCP